MLQSLIAQVLIDMGTPSDKLSSEIDILTRAMKDIAKQYFFKGKINSLSDYILGNDNSTNEKIHQELVEYLSHYMKKPDVFLTKLIELIQQEMNAKTLPQNISTLLDILGYGHLQGMLSMFNIK